MSELGHSSDERLELSTMISITWALGFMTGNGTYAMQGLFFTLSDLTYFLALTFIQRGIRATALAAIVFLILGLVLFIKYDEKSIMKTLQEENSHPESTAGKSHGQ